MTTIRDVAARAGVSLTTVSHVINNTRFVSDETKARIVEAMHELQYRPNVLARSLRSGKTYTIGLIMPDSENPFFSAVGREVEAKAFELGYSVILCNTERDAERQSFYVEVLRNKQVDGVIIIPTGDEISGISFLIEQSIPVVVIDRWLPDLSIDAVLTDNHLGGYQATKHLIDLGHRRIACIGAPAALTPAGDRLSGYRKALKESGIEEDPDLVLLGDYHAKSGSEAMTRLLALASPPTAVFAGNDLMAIGAMRAVLDAGLSVPQDVAVVGFDAIELARYTNPTLTTIAQPVGDIGSQAAALLIERIDDKTRAPRRPVLSTRLIVRQSTVAA